MATQFNALGEGLQNRYRDGDTKERSSILKDLVQREADTEMSGFKGKSADYKTARSSVERRLGLVSKSLDDLTEFGGKTLDQAASDKQAKADKERDTKLGFGTYAALQGKRFVAGLYVTTAALAGFTATATDKANGLIDSAGSTEDAREHVQSGFVASLRSYSDSLAADAGHIRNEALDRYGSTAEHQSQAEWANADTLPARPVRCSPTRACGSLVPRACFL